MGMYTELVCAIELKRDTPEFVLSTLRYMLHDSDDDQLTLPKHPLFKTDRWQYMLNGDSYYFSGKTNTRLTWDKIVSSYYLTIRCNLKNYNDEIGKFMDWISQYADEHGFVGYTRYEEADDPILIYIRDGKVEYKEV